MAMFTPNSELVKQEVDAAVQNEQAAQAAQSAADAAADSQARIILGLSMHLDNQWSKAKREKVTIEQRMLESKRARNGQYEPAKLAAIRALHGNDYVPVFAMLTETKCRSAESWIKEIVFPAGKVPWDIEPTPMPDMPPEVKQMISSGVMQEVSNVYMQGMMMSPDPLAAQQMVMQKADEIVPMVEDAINDEIMERSKEAASRMRKKIDDQFAEGGWEDAVREAIHDLCTYQAAFVKGPYVVKEATRSRQVDQTTGKWVTKIEDSFITKYSRRSPFDIYPGPGGCTIDDTYIFDKISLTPKKLQSLLGVTGYNDAEIIAVLEEGQSGKLKEWTAIETEKAYAENRETIGVYDTDTIDCLEYWGTAAGKDLLAWGMTPAEIPNSAMHYDICAWKIGSHVIKAMLNPDPLGGKPYSKVCFIEDPDNFWNKSLPEVIKHIQDMCNATCRAMINNVGIACLTGDTVVLREGQDRKYASVTLNDLWSKKHEHNSGLRRLRLRSLDESSGEFFGNKILDIVDNGIAEIFEVVTEMGYKIKATGNHRFMKSDGGWQLLDEFNVGDLIAVNGQVEPSPNECTECGAPTVRCGVRCRSCASKAANSSWNNRQIVESRDNKDTSATTARSRHDCQSRKKQFCEACGNTEIKLEQHHVDRDPWNNREENLKTLCYKCHPMVHKKEDSAGDAYLHRYVSYDAIVSIEYVGKERVFDLCMEGPNHNFIANGLVSHNSGPQVEVNTDRFPDGADHAIWPWKVWESTNSQMQEGKAVNFYAPPLITSQLIELYNFFLTMADDESGVPRFASGSPVSGGAMDTASGFSMLISQAARGIKNVIANIDLKLIEPTVRRQYYYNLDFEDISQTMVGDVKIIAKGTSSLVAKEQQAVRKRELLAETNNPYDQQIIGTKGRHEMLKDMLIALDMDPEKILPGEKEIDEIAEMMKMQQQQAMLPPGAPQAGPGKAPSPASETTAIDGGQAGGQASTFRDEEMDDDDNEDME